MTSFSIFTFGVPLLLMCQVDMFALGVEQKTLLYGCSYSDTCHGNINHQWCFNRRINSDHFHITSVSGATAGLYECCSSGILNMNTRDCCAALESGGQPTVSFNVTVRARPELSCEPSNCSVVIRPNDTSLSLKGVLRPAMKGFEIQQAQGLWKYNKGEISSNGTLPQHNNINVTIVGETSETLLLNGPGLYILNGTEFSFQIGFPLGDSICNTNDQPNTKITYTVVVEEFPVAVIFHKVKQREILCSTQDSITYPGDRYCLYVEDSGGERHEVECDDHPVSGDVEELKKWGNTAVCTVTRATFYNDTSYEIADAIAVYGGRFSLKCGEVGSCIPQGDWYHNGTLVQSNSTTLTMSNATFEDDGAYWCVSSGLNNSFLVAVYGQLGISPTDCDSKLNDICVKSILRGQSVKLCTRKTLIPSTPPEDGHVTKFIRAHWRREKSEGNLEELYKCFENDFCVEGSQTTPPVDYHRYSDVNESCITISDVQEDEVFSLELLVNPDIEYSPRTVTFAIRIKESPPPTGDTDDVIIVPISIAVVVVVIIVAIVVSFTTAMIIVIKYKHSRLTTNPTQSDHPQEPPSSSPSNLTVYRKKDVKTFEKIGRGSFWKVYRGKLSDSRCAIKRLRGVKKGGDHEGLVLKVLRELDMWSSLNHPNIISLYGIYHQDDINIPLLIVELMDRNLTDQLNSTFDPTHRKSLFPLKTKLSILSQVAGALDYLHCIKRVIHGDLTANNILLKENSPGSFTSKLTDFGMSRALNEQDNVMSTVQGTYWYMPPEVQNAGETTTKVDIYSFGVLCVHVLSHRFPKPLHALSVDDLGTHVVVSEFSRYRPYLMELDDDEKLLEPLIEECLQYEPEDRLRPEEVIGHLNSIEERLRLKETGPADPSHQPSVIHQQFSGPIVSGCTISGSVMNVGSFTDRNMQSLPVVDTAPLPAPLEVIPEVSFGDNMPNTSTSLTAPSEVNPA